MELALPAVLVPDEARGATLLVEEALRALLVDVADEPVVDAIAHELAEPGREAARDLARDAELLVLLLAHVARAVVHRDADATARRAVGAAAVPETAVP